MTQVDFNDIKRGLYADGCVDLLRGVACLRWSLLAGQSYEEAVRPWKKNLPELFDQGKAHERQRRTAQPGLCVPHGAGRPSPIARLSASGDRSRRRHVHA